MGLRQTPVKAKVQKVENGYGVFYVRVMSGDERYQLEKACFGKNLGTRNFAAELLCKTLCDENGAREFADNETAEVAKHDSVLLDLLYDAAYALNALGPKAVEEAKNG